MLPFLEKKLILIDTINFYKHFIISLMLTTTLHVFL